MVAVPARDSLFATVGDLLEASVAHVTRFDRDAFSDALLSQDVCHGSRNAERDLHAMWSRCWCGRAWHDQSALSHSRLAHASRPQGSSVATGMTSSFPAPQSIELMRRAAAKWSTGSIARIVHIGARFRRAASAMARRTIDVVQCSMFAASFSTRRLRGRLAATADSAPPVSLSGRMCANAPTPVS